MRTINLESADVMVGRTASNGLLAIYIYEINRPYRTYGSSHILKSFYKLNVTYVEENFITNCVIIICVG